MSDQTQTTTPTKVFGELTMEKIIEKINEIRNLGGIKLPQDYSPENAIRVAWLMLQEQTIDVEIEGNKTKISVLKHCTPESISNSLLKMVIWGMNPAKNQCSFIPALNQLRCQREYMGNITMAKRHGLIDVQANPIYSGDDFQTLIHPENGKRSIIKHDQPFQSLIEGKIIGAYAIVKMQDGSTNVEIMTMAQIQTSWQQGPSRGNSPAHIKFPDQMACKTVINRALKPVIRSSDDSDLFYDENEESEIIDTKAVIVQNEITKNANKTELEIKPDPVKDDAKELPEAQPNLNINVDAKQPEMAGQQLQFENQKQEVSQNQSW